MAASTAPPPRKRALPPPRVIAVFGGVVLVVLILGGYAGHWAWTGFSDNDTLWDWLQLLLLPIALATLPIWVRHHRFMDPRVRIALGVALFVFAAIVLLGYLVPWAWTGFTGNTLWDWLGLILFPLVIATVRFWSELRPRILQRHVVLVAALMTALVALVVIGYVRPWAWTGFTGNTLWDWINLVAVPLLFPLVIMPAALNLITTGVDERKEAAGHADAKPGDEEATSAPATTPAPAPAGQRGLATVAAAAVVALVIGGVAGALAFGGDSSSSTKPAKPAKPAVAASTPCTSAGARTIAAGEQVKVVQAGTAFYACTNGAAKPISLGADRGGVGPSGFAVTGGRVAFADRKCNAAGNCSTLVKLARVSDGHVFAPYRFRGAAKVADTVAGADGGMAVMLRDPAQLWVVDKQGARKVASGTGLDPNSLAQAGGTVYWRANGQSQGTQMGACAVC
jgi:hypothetical protein